MKEEKRPQIRARLLALFLACLGVTGLFCATVLGLYGSAARSQSDLAAQRDGCERFQWLYSQQDLLTEEYFQSAQQAYMGQLEEDGTRVYLLDCVISAGGRPYITPIYSTDGFATLYGDLTAEQLQRVLSAARQKPQRPAQAVFSRRSFYPAMLFQYLGENRFVGLVAPRARLFADPGRILTWSLGAFVLFAALATTVILGFGRRLDRATLQLDALNRQLAEQLRQKERLYTATQRMLANLSHDLKTPLTLMRANAEALRDGVLWEQRDALCAGILSESERLAALTERIVALARLEGALCPPRLTLFSLHDLVLDCCSRFTLPLCEKGLHLILPEDQEWLVCADYALTEQVLFNLLENAVTYTDPGGEIILRYQTQGELTCLQLFNTHAPLPAEELERLFEGFYRGEPSRAGRGHFGLGLSIVRSAATLMGGDCRCENQPGGLQFTLRLPTGKGF